MFMCVWFIGTTGFKIGSVLREVGANTSGKSLCIKSAFFRHSPAQIASVISVNNMQSVSLTFTSSVLCVTTSHGAFVCWRMSLLQQVEQRFSWERSVSGFDVFSSWTGSSYLGKSVHCTQRSVWTWVLASSCSTISHSFSILLSDKGSL